jgi:hypothetical protein
LSLSLLSLAFASCGAAPPHHRWESFQLSFLGPPSESLGQDNPFAIRLDVVFTAPDAREFRVPGFYAGNGAGGPDGDVWQVRFSADQNGRWTYRTDSDHPYLNAIEDSFQVIDPPDDAPDFYRWGRLEYVGEPYLKFRDGGYWVKAGADDPENILGEAIGDWASKREQIDYIAEKGINSIYVMTHNLDGDANDVWPWIGATSEEAKTRSDRFDIPKLQQWRNFFIYLQESGVALYMILEDDSAWTGYDRPAYYREMVARFGDLPVLYFNAGEEANENYSLDESIEHIKLLASIDPYDHPRAIHNVQTPVPNYIDTEELDLSSIQTWPSGPERLNELGITWAEACLARGKRPLVVNFDEARPPEDRRSVWAVYMARGLWEPIVYSPDSFAVHEPLWTELAAARRFVESLPFPEMFPANHLLGAGRGFCLAKPGKAYGVYLPAGGSVVLEAPEGSYRIAWYDPRQGRFLGEETASGPELELDAPDDQDWAVRVLAVDPVATAPTAASARIHSLRGAAVSIKLALRDADAPEAYDVEIVSPPSSGTLAGSGSDRIYTPNPSFTGQDGFSWQAAGDGWTSNIASVTIFANASGENRRPQVDDQRITVPAGGERLINLPYTDPDGPGPHLWTIRQPPDHGRLSGADNDVLYTPEQGFTGADKFTWAVSDGLSRSRNATVTITVR